MASPKRPKTYRVTGIPLTLTTETLKAALSEHLPSKGEDYIQIKVDIVPSCDSKFTNTALVSFTPHPPTYLEPLSNGITDIFTLYTVVAGYGALVIDMNMYGLTQLYATPPGENIVADIVAVTGIAGHAYGSWKAAGDSPKMWLRNFLAEDFPNCRTMIYGYNSWLESPGIHQIIDYRRSFLAELVMARATPEEMARPLIFIGHSFGGIIIAQSLVRSMEADRYSAQHSICLATKAVFFFGTPHRGLLLPDDILNAIDKHNHGERATLVESIGKGPVDEFLRVARYLNLKIYSFYEQLKTRKLEKGADGRFRRTGDYYVAVSSRSALLNFDGAEERIPVNADHTSMVKFVAKHLLPYTKVVDGLMTTISRMQIMGVPFTSYSIPRIVTAYDYPLMPSQGYNVPKRGNAKEPLADRNFSRGYALNPSQRGYELKPSQGYNIPEKGNVKELLAERKFSRERYLTWLDEYNKILKNKHIEILPNSEKDEHSYKEPFHERVNMEYCVDFCVDFEKIWGKSWALAPEEIKLNED